MKRVAILRGINVGGHRKILMADLRALFDSLGFKDVSTYIQSGNVIFSTTEDLGNSEIERKISDAIMNAYEFDVPVIVRTAREIADLALLNPFFDSSTDVSKLHLTFLGKDPEPENVSAITKLDFSPDKIEVKGYSAFIYCDGKYHTSKLTNDFIEKKLKVKATTRSWKTIQKLAELGSAN